MADLPPSAQDAVTRVATVAAESVVKKRRTKLVVQVALASFIAACGIALFVSKAVFNSNSQVNCQNVSDLAKLRQHKLNKEKGRTERFERESPDRLGLSQKRFNKLVQEASEEQHEEQRILLKIVNHNCS